MLVAEHLHGGVAQLGERLVCNQNVASSILVTSTRIHAGIAQLVERNFAKVKATSSNLVTRSSFNRGLAQLVRAPVLQTEGHWFEPSILYQNNSSVAQLVEAFDC